MNDDRREAGTTRAGRPGTRQHDAVLSDLVRALQPRATGMPVSRRPRVGFVGVEWPDGARLHDLASSGLVDVRTVSDPSPTVARDAAARLRNTAPTVRVLVDPAATLDEPLDGIVVARHTPDATGLIRAAIARGLAVFAAHPLAGSAREAADTVAVARAHDRLLGVDFRHRGLAGVAEMAALVRDGAIGTVFSADLAYHCTSGVPHTHGMREGLNGCLLELGSHLVDLALHVLDTDEVHEISGRRYASGRRLAPRLAVAEDHASAELVAGRGVSVRLACSWRADLGQPHATEALFRGTRGALRLRNVPGSPNAYRVEQLEGARQRTLGGTLDAWNCGAGCAWARRLARSPGFDESATRIPLVLTIIEQILAA